MAAISANQWNPAVLSIGLLTLLDKVPNRASKKNVHRLRTTVRRLEAQLNNCPKKVSKSLKALRKKAGRVRDIDVHLGILETPLLPHTRTGSRRRANPAADAKPQQKLCRLLQSDRKRQSSSLRQLVSDFAPKLKKRLPPIAEQAAQKQPTLQEAHQRCARARKRFLQWTHTVPRDAARLHRLRINTKLLRYELEPLDQFEEAAELADKFKQVQDAIGVWHDWATLSQIAQRELKSANAQRVQAALQAGARREYRKALRTTESVHAWIAHPAQPARTLTLVRKAS